MDVTESDLLTGEEKCQSSNAFGYILQFVVLYKWIIGNSFVQFGMTNILRPVVNTNVHVRSKITLSPAFYGTARGIEVNQRN